MNPRVYFHLPILSFQSTSSPDYVYRPAGESTSTRRGEFGLETGNKMELALFTRQPATAEGSCRDSTLKVGVSHLV